MIDEVTEAVQAAPEVVAAPVEAVQASPIEPEAAAEPASQAAPVHEPSAAPVVSEEAIAPDVIVARYDLSGAAAAELVTEVFCEDEAARGVFRRFCFCLVVRADGVTGVGVSGNALVAAGPAREEAFAHAVANAAANVTAA